MYFLAALNLMKQFFLIATLALSGVVSHAASIFDIRLNEVLASGNIVVNSNAHGVDLIELHNPTADAVDLTGCGLTDSSRLPKFTFPSGSVIPGNGFFVVQLDPDVTNNNFGITKFGDEVNFFPPGFDGNTPIDRVILGLQLENMTVGRVPNGSGTWTLLDSPSFGGNNVAATLGDPGALRINEWMASPKVGSDYMEIFNTGSLPVSLDGLTIEDSGGFDTRTPFSPLSFVGTNKVNAFAAFYSSAVGANRMPFGLGKNGDSITLRREDTTVIDSITFGPQLSGVSEGRLPDGTTTITSFPKRSTPGGPNAGLLTRIWLNELLAHTDPPLEDAVEFYNPGTERVEMGGWFMTDDLDNPTRFKFPTNFVVEPQSYAVLYEHQFRTQSDPTDFTFNSAHGGTLYIIEANAEGVPLSYLEMTFDATANGVSLGRIVTTDGDVDYTAMACRTFGQDAPKSVQQFRTGTGKANNCAGFGTFSTAWGPVIISEIMYHPTDEFGTNNVLDEYIELRNVTKTPVKLYDPAFPTNGWVIDGGAYYEFSGTAKDTIPGLGYLLLVHFDPVAEPDKLAAFTNKFRVPKGTVIRGPFIGNLANNDDIVGLYRPDPPQGPTHPDFGFVPYILTDRVHYELKSPWATNANGTGLSFQRLNTPSYGDEPSSWRDDVPTPGRPNAQPITILTQPLPQTALLSNAATFSVLASGSSPAYQWLQKNKPIPGANSATLTIPITTLKSAGPYSVVITNHAGKVTSTAANLSIVQPVVIRIQPLDRTVTEGTARTIFKTRATGTAPITYQWWLNGTEPIPGATSSTLIVTNAQSSMNGSTYTATASNALSGATSRAATLTVNPR
jgi:hypothetical protein